MDVAQTEKVSFVVATHNRKGYLSELISSIRSQTYRNIEIIIVNDESTDGTTSMLRNIEDDRIVVKNVKTGSPGINRKIGFDLTAGRYVIFVDDDDYYTDEDFVKKAMEIFHQSKVDNLFFNTQVLKDEQVTNSSLFHINDNVDPEYALTNFPIFLKKPVSTFSAVFSTDNLKKSGIDEMRALDDTQIYMRAFVRGTSRYIDEFVGVYRIHSGSITNNVSKKTIIENLNEIAKLSEDISFLKIDTDKWKYKGFLMTLNYYVSNSRTVSIRPIVGAILRLKPTFQSKLIIKLLMNRYRYYFRQ